MARPSAGNLVPTDREEMSRMREELVLPRSCCDDADCPPDCGDDCC
jgi:hypothetical protein